MQKERAASALKHGLPVPTPLPSRQRNDLPSSSRPARTSSWPPRGSDPSPPSRRVPIALKLCILVLAILGSIYGMTVFRDHLEQANAQRDRPKATLHAEGAILLAPSASGAVK
jgi:hypothetical protein